MDGVSDLGSLGCHGATAPARHRFLCDSARPRRRQDRIRIVAIGLAVCGLVLPAAATLWKAPTGESTESRTTESYEERESEALIDACLRHGRQRPQRLNSGERLDESCQPRLLVLARSTATMSAHCHGHRRPDGSLAPLRL